MYEKGKKSVMLLYFVCILLTKGCMRMHLKEENMSCLLILINGKNVSV